MGLMISFTPRPLYSMTVPSVQKGKEVAGSTAGLDSLEKTEISSICLNHIPIPWSSNPHASHNTNRAIPALEIPYGYKKYDTHTLQAYPDLIFGL